MATIKAHPQRGHPKWFRVRLVTQSGYVADIAMFRSANGARRWAELMCPVYSNADELHLNTTVDHKGKITRERMPAVNP